MISVIVPIKDGGDDLRRCLEGVERKGCGTKSRLLVVDSGSTDGSVDVARSHGASVYEGSAEEFLHGRTRNVAARQARGELLVFTSQDAYAEREDWLEQLTSSLETDTTLAAVYGRQIPRQDARPPERFFLDFLYGPVPRMQRAADRQALSLRTTMFSNVNSAIRRSIWAQFPFSEGPLLRGGPRLVTSSTAGWLRDPL